MNLHEYQAADILASYGIPVNAGQMVTDAAAAARAAEQLGGRVALKAQVHSGGRGKAGGIKLATSPDDARAKAGQILGMDIRGHTVRRLLVVPAVGIQREYYLGMILDRATQGVTLMASAEGGVDIEEVARERPEQIVRVTADPQLGLLDYQARAVAFKLGVEPARVAGFVSIAKALYAAFVGSDASLAEINPLILTDDNRWQALDSKIVLDDNGLARHTEFEALRDPDEENATETRARARGVSFVKLDGDIGCVVNGAGLAMATMDAVKLVRRRAGQLPGCRRRRQRRAGRLRAGADPGRPQRARHPLQHLRRHHALRPGRAGHPGRPPARRGDGPAGHPAGRHQPGRRPAHSGRGRHPEPGNDGRGRAGGGGRGQAAA